jgi:hypothetical protein
MTTLLSLVLLFCLIAAISSWRIGLYCLIIAAIVQDPLRKIVPEEPVYFTLFAAIVLMLTVLNTLARGMSLRPSQVFGWSHRLGTPFVALLFWILLQTLHSLVLYGSVLATAVGLATYLAPIPAILVGYQFALRTGYPGIENWIRFYLVIAGFALLTVFLQYAGVESDLFGQVGEGAKIYDLGTVLIGKTGTFRSTEVAAWHAMAGACFAFIGLTSSKMSNQRLALGVAVALIMIAVAVLTGRRKSILAVAIFATTYFFLFSIFRKELQGWLVGFFTVGATLFLIVTGVLDSDTSDGSERAAEYQLFLERSTQVFADTPERVLKMSLGQAEWSSQVTGLFGAGVGVATSGARHVGKFGQQFRGLGEGGVGKVLAELGIPGFILIAWFMLALLQHVRLILKFTARQSLRIFRLSAALVAFLLANVTTFFINTQVFSDFFVLIVFGLTLGFLLAMPVLAQRSVSAAPQKANPGMARATARL